MNDVIVPLFALILTALVIAFLANRFPAGERSWIWLAFAERLFASGAQLVHSRLEGSDQNGYRETGQYLAHLMDMHFSWAFPEVVKTVFQQPSALDTVVVGSGTNTGSMFAVAGLLEFVTFNSDYGVQIILAAVSTISALALYDAFRKASPSTTPFRLFFATALFPSVAFWTTGLLKETFCIFGIAVFILGWNGFYTRRWVRGVLFVLAGTILQLVFRPPSLPPLLLGCALFAVTGRKGAAKPLYLVLAVGVVFAGMVLVGRVAPELSVGQLNESVAKHQQSWTVNGMTGGGSAYDLDEVAITPSQQAMRAPLALLNALLRPQLFDVRNFLMLISALEMTAITYFVLRSIKQHGVRSFFQRISGSPVLIMCAVITVVGSTFVGLTTLNFGSLSRYRAPFLPFYGVVLAIMTDVKSPVRLPSKVGLRARPARRNGATRPGTAVMTRQ